MNKIRWLRGTAVLLLLIVMALIVLIGVGTFDPQPVGDVQWRQTLSPYTIPAQTRQITWLERPLPPAPYSLRLIAAHQSGATDSLYGLALGSDTDALAVAITPLGYVTIQQWAMGSGQWIMDNGQWTMINEQLLFTVHRLPLTAHRSPLTAHRSPLTVHLPLQPWPHVRTGAQSNEIWIDVANGQVTVRVNREWLWTGAVAVPDGVVGLIGESFGDATTVDFQTVILYAERP